MRQNSQEFNIFNQSSSKDLRLVIMLDFATPVYFSSHADIPNLPANTITDTVKKTSSISQSINPDVARAEIGKLTFSLLDLNGAVTQAFRNANAQNQGLNGLTVKLYRGGLGMDFADFRLEQTQQIDKEVSYNNSVYSVTCADIQRKLRSDIFDLAKTQLTRDFLANETTIEVSTTEGFEFCDHVASFSDQPTGKYIYLKIYQGDLFEIARASGKTATTFTGIERGLFGTNDISHSIPTDSTDDNGIVVEEYVYIELPIPVMAYAMLTGDIIGGGKLPTRWHLGIDPSSVNTDAFINIGEDLFDENDFSKGFITYFSGLTKTDGKTFIEKEICLLMGAFMPVLSDGKLSLKLMSSVLSGSDAIAELNEDNIVSHSKITYDHSKIHNQIEINWAYLQFVGQDPQFYRKHTLLDSNSINKHGLGSVYKLSFKGLHSSRHTITHIHNLFDALRDRYAGPPVLLTATLLPSMNDLEQGDIVRVKLPQQRDFMGFDRIERAFEVQKVTVDQITGKVTVSLFGSSDKASVITESDATTDWALQDSWYTSNGSSMSSLLNISNGTLQQDGTLPGTVGTKTTQAYWISIIKNSHTSRKLYHFDGDLLIPNGVTLTLWDNVGLLVKGHLQVDGEIRVKKTPDEYLTSGYLGVTISQGSFHYDRDNNGNYVNKEKSGHTLGYHPANSPDMNSNTSVPALNITQDQYGLHGVPGDMCGTSGKDGKLVNDGSTYKDGGAGGVGGGSLLIVARGLAFGVSGFVDTSGEDGSIGDLIPEYDYYSGSGAGGAPGALVVLIDGIDSSFPVLTNSIKAKFGLSPLVGDALGSGNGPWHSTKYVGKSQTREDLGINATHIQYVPQYRQPFPTQGELLNTLSDVSGLIYSQLTDNINQGLLSWDAVEPSFNAKYRVKLFDDNGGHVWVKYASDSSGSNMSDSATAKTHIGFALNQSSATKSLVASDYQWFVIDSSFGYEVTGLQGEQRFIWVKYATNLQGINHVDGHAGNSYIGIAINKRSNTKSASASDYLWFSAFGSSSLDHNDNPPLISNQLLDDNELYISGLGAGKYRASVAIVTDELSSAYSDVLVEIITDSFSELATNYEDERIANTVAIEAAKDYADSKFIDSVQYGTDITELQSQIDGNVTTWFQAGVPTLANAPANEWVTTALKNQHLSDIYYDDNTGFAYRFKLVNTTYSWAKIDDSDITKALSDAAKAQDTADGKRRVFVVQPIPPYDVGDLWDTGNGFSRCIIAKLVNGVYAAGDWKAAADITDYDDTRVSNSEISVGSLGAIPSDTTLFPRYKSLSAIHGTGAITTSQFVAALTSAGCFNGNHNVFKTSWSYAGHGYISDTNCGVIDLAGATIEVIGTSSTYMIRVTSAPSASGHGGLSHTTWEYRYHGSAYNPGWRMVLNSGNFQNSITQAFINSLNVDAATLGGYGESSFTRNRGSIGDDNVLVGSTANWPNNPLGGSYRTDYAGASGLVMMSNDVGGSTSSVALEFSYNGKVFFHSNTDSNKWNSYQIYTEETLTKAVIDALNVDASTLDDIDSTGFMRTAADGNGYWGLTPQGNSAGYVRSPQNGIIPFDSSKQAYLGTTSWRWKQIHGQAIYEAGISLSNRYLGLSALNYNDSATYAAAWLAVEEFKKWVTSGSADNSAYDTVTDSIATAFINSIIGQFNIVVANKANVGYLSANAISVGLNDKAVNENPYFQAEGAAAAGNSANGWSVNPFTKYGKQITDGIVADTCAEVTNNNLSGGFWSDDIHLEDGKVYKISLWIRNTSATVRTQYLACHFKDANGTRITSGGTGWSLGTYCYWGRVNQAIPGTDWVKYEVTLANVVESGDSSSFKTPAGTATVSLGILANYSASVGTGEATIQIQDYRIEEMTTSTTIVDGTITADKIAANAITADKVAANAITANKIATNAITAIKIAANAITAIKIAANAITADKIAANAITADKIAANAITANEINVESIFAEDVTATGTISGAKLIGGSVKTATTGDRIWITDNSMFAYVSGDNTPFFILNDKNSVYNLDGSLLYMGHGTYNGSVVSLKNNSAQHTGKFQQYGSGDAVYAYNYGSGHAVTGYVNNTTQASLFVNYGSGRAIRAVSSSGEAAEFVSASGKAPFLVNRNVVVTNLNADMLDGYHGSSSALANTYALRNSSGDIFARLLRSTYQNQSTISGAIAFRVNNGSDNYTRYCSSPSAVRTWLNTYSKSDVYNKTETYAKSQLFTQAEIAAAYAEKGWLDGGSAGGYGFKDTSTGFTVKTGRSYVGANSTITTTFSEAFTTIFTAVASGDQTNSGEWAYGSVYSRSNTQITIQNQDNSAHYIDWIAIGYT